MFCRRNEIFLKKKKTKNITHGKNKRIFAIVMMRKCVQKKSSFVDFVTFEFLKKQRKEYLCFLFRFRQANFFTFYVTDACCPIRDIKDK